MLRVAVLVIVVAATAARAQAPGEVTPLPPGAAADAPSVMDRRWAIELSLGSIGLKADRDGADNVTFGMFELAGRFRIRSFVDVGVSLYGGGAGEGDLSTAGLFVDGRYRFLAENPWNIYALLSLGVASVADKNASDAAKAGRGAVRIGAGVERRFRAFAIHAELRLMGVGENSDFMPTELTPNNEMAKSKLNGGSLSIGGTFYF